MVLTKLPFVTLAGVGLGLALGAGYLIMRGPFLGGALLEPVPLMTAVAGFFVGVFTFTYAAAKLVGVGVRM